MATYQETVYASDSWLQDENDNISRSSTLKIEGKLSRYLGYVYGEIEFDEYDIGHITFPAASEIYSKKRLLSSEIWAYVTAKNSTFSGSLPSGVTPYYACLLEGSEKKLSTLSLNQFNLLGAGNKVFGADEERLETYLYLDTWYGNVNYNSTVSFTIRSHSSASIPYRVLTFEDVIPTVKNCYPNSGFVNEQAANTFRWEFSYNKTGVKAALTQGQAIFRWRPYGESAYTELTVEGAQQYITIPAGTFGAENIEWQVAVVSDDGIQSAFSNWMKVSTVDALSSCTDLSPADQYFDGSVDTVFSWNHTITTGTQQSAFDLQYSANGGTSWTDIFIHQAGANQYVTIPADTLPAGNLLWRARTYNSDDAAGEWSTTAAIVVIARPPMPSYTAVGSGARPILSWSAVGQQSFEIVITDTDGDPVYSSGETASTVKRHHVRDYLDDGSYTAALRVKNVFGLSSDWAEISLTVETEKPAAPVLTAAESNGATVLTVQTPQEYAAVYVLRDDLPIAKITGKIYTDNPPSGIHAYKIRAVDANDNFSDSNIVTVETAVSGAELIYAGTDGGVRAALKLALDDAPELNGDMAPQGSSYNVAGRIYPVREFSETRDESLSLAYAFAEESDFTVLRKMVQSARTLLFRSSSGESMYCVIPAFSWKRQPPGIYSCSFTTVRVDYDDRIDYDAPEG